MEKQSRVKKYEQLRESVYNDVDTSQANNIQETLENNKQYEPIRKKVFQPTYEEADTFKNEYLDSFIQEVREYNINKGIKEYDDTRLDILSQLQNRKLERRTKYVEQEETHVNYEEDTSTLQTSDISKQVFSLIEENDDMPVIQPVSSIEVEEVMDSVNKDHLENRIQELERKLGETQELASSLLRAKDIEEQTKPIVQKDTFLQETTQIKKQMHEYEQEVQELNSSIDSNNKLLNAIIVILVIALVAVIGFAVFWMMNEGVI